MSKPFLDSLTQGSKDKLKYLLLISSLFLIGTIWYLNEIQPGNLATDVSGIQPVAFLKRNGFIPFC